MYHSAAFARERDKIRQAVLEGLGWTLFRVWSTDWWIHRAKAIETLHQALTEQLVTDRQRREEAAQTLDGNGSAYEPAVVLTPVSQDTGAVSVPIADADEIRTPVSEPLAPQQAQFARRTNAIDSSADTSLTQTPVAADDLFGATGTQYVDTRFDDARHRADPGLFHSDE